MGRGSSGAKSTVTSKSRFSSISSPPPPATPQKKNTPMTGAKVQSDYIQYIKQQLNIDLSKARDTQFDNRKGFNIDTRQLSLAQLRDIKNHARKYPGDFDVSFGDNGAYRVMVLVKRRKK